MRTVIIIVAGLILLAICLGASRLLASDDKPAMAKAIWLFIALWFVVAAVNMWVGVTQAGYGAMEELPIFLLIFGLPVAVALLVKWKFA